MRRPFTHFPKRSVVLFGIQVVLFGGMFLGWVQKAKAQAPAQEETVQLPPLMVEETKKAVKWTYTKVANIEVLSSCSGDTTETFAKQIYVLERVLETILPLELQWQSSRTYRVLLYNAGQSDVTVKSLVNANKPEKGSRSKISMLPNLRIDGEDAMVVCASVNEKNPRRYESLSLQPGYVMNLMQRRSPRLPSWFMQGIAELNMKTKIKGNPPGLEMDTMDWTTPEETRGLKTVADWPRVLLSMEEVFKVTQETLDSKKMSEELFQVWSIQSELFVRWGLDPQHPGRREAFRYFVGRASSEPMSESLVEECLGLNYAELREQLGDSISDAIKTPYDFPDSLFGKLSVRISVKAATDLQIGLIKGYWERMAFRKVAARKDEISQQYLKQARRTLSTALGKVDRNCELLALCGQLELDAGNNDRAQYYLEQALKLGTLPPRAAFDLALLRMNGLSYQEGGRTKLPPDRVEELKVLFRMAHEQKPPLFHVYELWTAVCASTGVVTQEDLKALEFGAQHFPQRKKLVLAASYFCKAMGRPHAALALCDRALAEAHDESPERSALLKMQAELRVKCRSGP